MHHHAVQPSRSLSDILYSAPQGIRPAVVALIAVPTFNLGKRAQLNRYTIWIPIACALAIWALGVSPIYIIIIAAIGGYIYGKYIKATC